MDGSERSCSVSRSNGLKRNSTGATDSSSPLKKPGSTRAPPTRSRFSDYRWQRKRKRGPKSCLLGRGNCFVFLFRLRQNERRFAGPLQLQLLANLHLLFAAAFL